MLVQTLAWGVTGTLCCTGIPLDGGVGERRSDDHSRLYVSGACTWGSR